MYIELRHIHKSFGDFKASDDVSFSIEKGKLIGLLGPSGSGKTTILRMLAGLEHQDSGDIYIDGKLVNDLPSNERGIGFVFQSYALFPYLNVYQNIAYGLNIQKKDKAFIQNRVRELLDLVGLPGIHVEVKRVEKLNVSEAMRQAERDAERFLDGAPAVFHRRNREPWLVTMRLSDWLALYQTDDKRKEHSA